MYAAWGTGSLDMYEDVEDLALMAIEESDVNLNQTLKKLS